LITAIDSGRFYSLRCYTRNKVTNYPDSLLFKQFILPGIVVKPAIGYFDGDDYIDLIIYNNTNIPGVCTSCIAFYEFDPTVQKFSLRQSIDIEDEIREFAVADIDSDSLYEFFTGSAHNYNYSYVLGFKNISNNTYKIILKDTLYTPNLYTSRIADDLDKDGYLDILVAGITLEYTQLYWLAYSDSSLKIIRKLVLKGTDIFRDVHLDLYDVDNDGIEEFIFNVGFGVLILKWSNITNHFEILYYHELTTFRDIYSIEFYDFDGNTIPDMFISVGRVVQPSFITYYYKSNFIPSSVSEQNIIPTFQLYQNFPNPFNPVTTIKYDVPKPGNIELIIYDILGRKVTTLVDKRKQSGRYEVVWDASNAASGIYFYQLRKGNFVDTKKMILLK